MFTTYIHRFCIYQIQSQDHFMFDDIGRMDVEPNLPFSKFIWTGGRSQKAGTFFVIGTINNIVWIH